MTSSRDIEALPAFLREHADDHPDPAAVLGLVALYEDTLEEFRTHPYWGGPVRQDEMPSIDGPPTFQRISGRLDGLFLAMKWLAMSLSSKPGYQKEWGVTL